MLAKKILFLGRPACKSLIISLIIRLELVVVRTIGLIVRTIRLTVRIPAFRGTREADNSTISLQPDTSRGIVLVVRSALSWPRAAKSRTTGLGAITGLIGSHPSYPSSNLRSSSTLEPPVSSAAARNTDFSRLHCAALSHLSRCPLNALMPGSETGSLPRSAVGDATAWQTSLLTTLSYCAHYMGGLAPSPSCAGAGAGSARCAARTACCPCAGSLRCCRAAASAGAIAGSAAACGSVAGRRKHRVWAAPDAKTYRPTDLPPIPPRYKGEVLRTKTGEGVGSVSAT